MKSRLTHTKSPVRLLLFGATGLLLLAAMLPPLLHPAWGIPLMEGFSLFCHQLPARSFSLNGSPIALCHRCTGVMMGLLVGMALPIRRRLGLPVAALLAIALAPMTIDWAVEAFGFWTNTALTRVGTGLWGGVVLGVMILGSTMPRDAEARMTPA